MFIITFVSEYRPELNYSNNAILQRNPNIKTGGHWEPADCTARYHTALIIPFRDRISQLPILLGHLHSLLQYQLMAYRIFVVEQVTNLIRASIIIITKFF